MLSSNPMWWGVISTGTGGMHCLLFGILFDRLSSLWIVSARASTLQ